MADSIEVWTPSGRSIVALPHDHASVGSSEANDISTADPLVSRAHAVLERMHAGWCVRDLGSRNGTFVNGERLDSTRALRSGDEIRVGSTLLVLHAGDAAPLGQVTQAAQSAPELTRREREVLVAICRPVLRGDMFTEPASIREVAESLVVSEAAVKHHLFNLYDKFGIHGRGERRRVRLANEAVRRGAVSMGDLRDATP